MDAYTIALTLGEASGGYRLVQNENGKKQISEFLGRVQQLAEPVYVRFVVQHDSPDTVPAVLFTPGEAANWVNDQDRINKMDELVRSQPTLTFSDCSQHHVKDDLYPIITAHGGRNTIPVPLKGGEKSAKKDVSALLQLIDDGQIYVNEWLGDGSDAGLVLDVCGDEDVGDLQA